MDNPRAGAPFRAPPPKPAQAEHPLPHEGQKIDLHAAVTGGRVEGFEHKGTLCVAGKHGAIFITRENAKEFFGLVEPLKEGRT